MTDEQLDQIVAAASPVAEADVAAFDFGAAEADLLREILAAPASAPAPPARLDERRRRRMLPRSTAPRTIAALVGVAAAATLAFVGITSIGGDSRQAFAAEAIRIAEANPRLLVSAPGWSVVRADEFTIDDGEMTFSDGEGHLDVHWRPARTYESYLRDRGVKGNARTELTLLGRPATMFRYADSTDFTTLLRPQGPTFVEVRGDLGSRERYLALLRSLRAEDVETWLAAMPANAVRPGSRAKVVDEMLEGVPIPPGLDLTALREGDTVSDRYQLGAQVTGAVACGWLARWTRATAAGDAAVASEAVRAMATSRTWPVLHEMNDEGDYPEVLWSYADQMTKGETTRAVKGGLAGGGYASALGCDSR